jgi:hypothetical protein
MVRSSRLNEARRPRTVRFSFAASVTILIIVRNVVGPRLSRRPRGTEIDLVRERYSTSLGVVICERSWRWLTVVCAILGKVCWCVCDTLAGDTVGAVDS